MTGTTIFVGLDVHKKTIAVATVEGRASAEVRFFRTIANTPEAIRSMLRKLAKDGQKLHLAYEAGPLGYTLFRQATGLRHRCDVVAPSLIPRKAGDKVKTDRRDAMTLAQTLRAGQLTEVWVCAHAHLPRRPSTKASMARAGVALDPIVEAFRQQRQLAAIRPGNEPHYRSPPQIAGETYATVLFTQ